MKMKMKTVTVPACSICDGPLYEGDAPWKHGNNAEPINDGRCCNRCDMEKVLPARMKKLRNARCPVAQR